MEQKDRELLLKDLGARLVHGVIIQHPDLFRPSVFVTEKLEEYYKGHFGSSGIDVEFVKPYLRPMSSMTEEEKMEYNSLIGGQKPFDFDFSAYPVEYKFVYERDVVNYVDWLNSRHFDYRGLIPKGLAIEAPEGMYNEK